MANLTLASNIDSCLTDDVSTRSISKIISTCLILLSLCAWKASCINVPRSRSKRDAVADYFYMMMLNFLNPWLVLLLAAGQLSSAWAVRRTFRELGYGHWTVTHAFLANAGGFEIHSQLDGNAKRYDGIDMARLVSRRIIDCPRIAKSEIDDKSKQDPLTRIVVFGKAAFFVAVVTKRLLSDLHVTQLELILVNQAMCSAITTMVWMMKPSYVSIPFQLVLNTGWDWAAVDKQVIDLHGHQEWIGSRIWRLNVKILHRLSCRLIGSGRDIRRTDKITSFDFRRPAKTPGLLILMANLLSYACYICPLLTGDGFPTIIEKWLWLGLVAGQALPMLILGPLSWYKMDVEKESVWDKELGCALYSFCRVGCLVVACLELRKIPCTAKIEVGWTRNFWF